MGKIMKLKKVAALVAAGAVATNLVACSSFSGGSATTAAAETTAAAAETKAEETTAAAAKDGEAKGIKVGFTNSYNGNSYRQTEENMKTLEKLLDLVGTCEVIDCYLVKALTISLYWACCWLVVLQASSCIFRRELVCWKRCLSRYWLGSISPKAQLSPPCSLTVCCITLSHCCWR